MQTSVYVDERTIHEGEMQAFEASVRAGARSLMCAYNRLDIFVTPPTPGQGDVYSCSNDYTLNQVLKGREPFDYVQTAAPPSFGFTGNVGSDYGATHRPSDLIYGLDTEQPGAGNLGNPVINAIGTCSAGNATPCSGPGTAAIATSADLPAVPAYTADQWKTALDNAVFHSLQMYNAAGYLEGTPYGSQHADTCTPANLAGGASAGCVAVTPPRQTVADLDPASRAAAQTIAERSAVLLKDDGGFYPLSCSDFTGGGVLVTGPTAFAPYTGGGGSAHVTPKPNVQSPYDALVAAAASKCGGNPAISATPGYLPGTTVDGWPVPTQGGGAGGSAVDPGSHPGLLRTQAGSGAVVPPGTAVTPCSTSCAAPQDDRTVNYSNYNNAVLAPGTGWVWQGSVTAPATDGPWILRVCYANQAASATNGAIQLFASATPFAGGIPQATDRVINVTSAYADQSGAAQTGQCHAPGGAYQNASANGAGTNIPSGATRFVELRAVANGTSPLRLRLVWAPTTGATFQTEALNQLSSQASTANKVIDFVYDDGTEGSDRGNNAIANGLTLAANQNLAVTTAVTANANTGVVLNTGDSVFMPWESTLRGLLEMWYPGQMGAAATADLLLGNVDPGGKLPETFYDVNAPVGQRFPQDTQPAACEDNSANYGTANGAVSDPSTEGQCPEYPGVYLPNNLSDGTTGNRHGYRTINFSDQTLDGVKGNGIFTGYRWFDENGYTPLFPFGFGLSYTTFAYSNLSATPTPTGLTVGFDVENTGSVSGDEVAQVYLGAPSSAPVPMAVRALAGFRRVSLDPGQTTHVTVEIPARSFQYWSTDTHDWAFALGPRTVYVGSSSRDFRLTRADATAPLVTITPDRAPDHNGWYNHAVTFTATAQGVAEASVTCDAPKTYSTPDSGTASVTMSCTDSGGDTGSATVTFQYDATAPVVTYTGNAGSYAPFDNVSIHCSATDATSGIATSSCADIVGPAYTFGFGSHTFSAGATDNAGNASSATATFTVTTAGCLSGSVTKPVSIGAGQSACVAPGTTVTGPVTVNAGGSLFSAGATFTGPVRATGAAVVRVCGSSLNGPLTVGKSTGLVVVGGDAATGPCDGNRITGPVSLTDNTAGVEFNDNTVTGPLTITGTTGTLPPPDSGSVHAEGNTVTGPTRIQP
jgi:beta-glucosidase